MLMNTCPQAEFDPDPDFAPNPELNPDSDPDPDPDHDPDRGAATLANHCLKLPTGWPAWLREAAALAGVLTWSLAWLYASSRLALLLPAGAP